MNNSPEYRIRSLFKPIALAKKTDFVEILLSNLNIKLLAHQNELTMDDKSFDEIYPSIVEIAKSIGVQTIFISKYKPASVNDEDLIDITEGFNPFHLSSKS